MILRPHKVQPAGPLASQPANQPTSPQSSLTTRLLRPGYSHPSRDLLTTRAHISTNQRRRTCIRGIRGKRMAFQWAASSATGGDGLQLGE